MASRAPLDGEPPRAEEPAGYYRFGRFEFDAASGELRKGGATVRLRQQPARLLSMLLSKPGVVLTREELRSRLWESDTFVDFDQGLNYCVKEIRAAIGDNAEAPVFVETLPRRGYRWIGPLEPVGGAVARPRDTRWRGLAVAGAALAFAAGFGLALLRPPGSRPQDEPRSWHRITFRRGLVSAARFAPGGDVVYTAAWEGREPALYVASPGAAEPRSVGTLPGVLTAVSARGEAFCLAGPDTDQLLRGPLSGGAPKPLMDGVLVADASADGERLVAARQVRDGKGVRLEFPLGHVVARMNRPGALRLAPGGERLAVVEHPVAADDAGVVLVVDRAGQVRAVGGRWASIEGLAWSPRGDEVWVTGARAGGDTSVHAIRLDSGAVRAVLTAGGRLVLHDVGPDGRMLLERAASRPQVFFGREGESERELTWLDGSWPQDLASDGSALLFTESGEGGGPGYAVYVRPTDGSPPVRLSSGRALSLAPDGHSALVTPAEEGDRIEQVPIGAGDVRLRSVPGIAGYLWARLLPDGRLLFSGNVPDHNMRAWLAGDGDPRPITPEQIVVARDLLSPDGGTLVAGCPPQRLCLYPTDGASAPAPIVGLGRAAPLRWDAGGRRLFVSERVAGGVELLRLDPWSGRREFVRRLSPADPVGTRGITRVLITPDGRAWAYAFVRRLSELFVVDPARP